MAHPMAYPMAHPMAHPNFAVFTNIARSGKFRVKVLKGRTIGIMSSSSGLSALAFKMAAL